MIWICMSVLLFVLNYFHVTALPIWVCALPLIVPVSGLVLAGALIAIAMTIKGIEYLHIMKRTKR